MPTSALTGLLDWVHHRCSPSSSGAAEDAELLRRWVANRDAAAFEVLLWRHSRLVWGVCQRLLSHRQDVEDAFQATFLVLVRKAGSISSQQALASWLYTVAHRVARQSKSRTPLVTTEAKFLEEIPDRPSSFPDRELLAVIEEEINRLPECYREVFILCHLLGKTNEEAAQELRRPIGTVQSRLTRARKYLRSLLSKRGIRIEEWPVLCVPVPTAMVSTTIESTVSLVTGANVATNIVPVFTLMEGVLQAMVMTKLKIAATVVLSIAFLGIGGGVIGYRAAFAQDAVTTSRVHVTQDRNKKKDSTDTSGPAGKSRTNTTDPTIAELQAKLDAAMVQVQLLQQAIAEASKREQANLAKTTTFPPRVQQDITTLEIQMRRADVALKSALALQDEYMKQLREASSNANLAIQAPTIRLALLKAMNDVKIKELDVVEAKQHLERAMQLLKLNKDIQSAKDQKAGRSIEERIKVLEDRVSVLEKKPTRR